METVSKGSFLKAKASNMIAWLSEAGILKGELPAFTELQATFMAEMLLEKQDEVAAKSFTDLLQSKELSESQIGDTFRSILEGVRDNPVLHEKFWRYLALFVDVVKQ